MWKKIRAKAPDTQKRCGWEKNTKPSLSVSHPGMELRGGRVVGHARGMPALSLSPLGASPQPAYTLGAALQGGDSNAQACFTRSLLGCWWGDTFLQLRDCI